MPIIADPWFWVLAIPAVLLSGITKAGFASGAGNAMVPLMSLVIPAPQAAGISLPLLCAMDIASLRAWWGRWSLAELRAIMPGGLLGLLIGVAVFGLLFSLGSLSLVHLVPRMIEYSQTGSTTIFQRVGYGFGAFAWEATLMIGATALICGQQRIPMIAQRVIGTILLIAGAFLMAWRLSLR